MYVHTINMKTRACFELVIIIRILVTLNNTLELSQLLTFFNNNKKEL